MTPSPALLLRHLSTPLASDALLLDRFARSTMSRPLRPWSSATVPWCCVCAVESWPTYTRRRMPSRRPSASWLAGPPRFAPRSAWPTGSTGWPFVSPSAKLASPPAEKVQQLRAIQVLEYMATPEARQLLVSLAKGAPEARLTREAKAALQRLEQQKTKP